MKTQNMPFPDPFGLRRISMLREYNTACSVSVVYYAVGIKIVELLTTDY